MALLLLMRRILPPLIRIAYKAASREWQQRPQFDPEEREIAAQTVDWEHSRWKWLLVRSPTPAGRGSRSRAPARH